MQKVLVTGSSGRIGEAFVTEHQDRYEFVLSDVREPARPIEGPHRFVQADLSDPSTADALCLGVDAVVHLAGIPDPDAEFDDLLHANILATTYLIDATWKAGCRRFIYASSAQTIEGYPVDRQVVPGMGVAPANLYGVSKCYGEALCSLYATQHGMSCVSLRIGAFEPSDGPPLETMRDLSAWLSRDDATHLIDRAIQAEISGHFIAHGISNNRFKRLDLTETRRVLGYAPKDDAFSTFPLPSG
ncbi:NAD-dependent epimerase/dehydratase family protein [Roseobacter sinensis]|uniref:NAD(P)-dependent oxidoreductase n=1 Tax=Roseobacter sinensis TaxID=2931391 RepID=A0ABT3BLJ5_9RHOB|nr:NAD(P)-dependent oxidoreductase [Roseobacter sp. WL0113]MCV3274430.1 NAD(P)-dependent oxidoreductase [Roseobacter sp. WL0113]